MAAGHGDGDPSPRLADPFDRALVSLLQRVPGYWLWIGHRYWTVTMDRAFLLVLEAGLLRAEVSLDLQMQGMPELEHFRN